MTPPTTARTRAGLTWQRTTATQETASTPVGTYAVSAQRGPDERKRWVATFTPALRGASAIPIGDQPHARSHSGTMRALTAARMRAQEHYDALMRGEVA